MNSRNGLLLLLLGVPGNLFGTPSGNLVLESPDGQLSIAIETAPELRWSVRHGETSILEPSRLALHLADGEILGDNPRVSRQAERSTDQILETPLYRKNRIRDHYEELEVHFEGNFGLRLRAYNDAAAYQFFTEREGPLVIFDERAEFNFEADHSALIPYANDYRDGVPFVSSFEAYYTEAPISAFEPEARSLLPLLIKLPGGKKAVILEADLQDYPGMYLERGPRAHALLATFPRYPLATEIGGYREMNLLPTERAPEIARTEGPRSFPWRILAVSTEDRQLLDNDCVYKLSPPSRLSETSWIRPGHSTWDWWNDWTLRNVDFVAGQNTATYRHHIDFAAAYGIEYITIDWGWTEVTDLTQRNPEVDLEAIVAYGESRDVGVIVWASWRAVLEAQEWIFAEMERIGIRGMKIDFIDRDDQLAVASVYTLAARAAEHHLILNFHGMYKPSGLSRTFPNVLNFEGIKGLENEKWANEDAPRNAALIPFLRMLAGPMDYTPGAMHNATEARFAPINDAPMSKGTRCHQAAMYVLYDAPLQMLADSPSRYQAEPAYTRFLTRIPTTFDETVPLAGEVGEYLAIARQKDGIWYLAALTNWTPRALELDLSFLGPGEWNASILADGINAHREASDYRQVEQRVEADMVLPVQLAPGGGWVARFELPND